MSPAPLAIYSVDENQTAGIRPDVGASRVAAREHFDAINLGHGKSREDACVDRERSVHVDARRSILVHATTPAEQDARTTAPLIADRCAGNPIPNTVEQIARELGATQHDP